MKKKVKQTNDHAYLTPPDTQDTIAARNAARNVDFTTPIVGMYGQAEKDLANMDVGDETMPAGTKEKIRYSRMFNLRNSKAQALAGATAQQEQAKFGNLAQIAGMTAPNLVQTGSTQTVSDPMGAILGAAKVGGNIASLF